MSPVGKIKIEVIPWLSQSLQPGRSGRLVMEESIDDHETVRQFLGRMAGRYPAFSEHVFDLQTQELKEHVAVVLNDRMIELLGGLDEPLKEGDTLTLLPTFQGG